MSNSHAIWACLQEHGISNKIARAISQHELHSWKESDLRRILLRVDATKSDIENHALRSFHAAYGSCEFSSDSGFVKPAWQMVQRSGMTLGALCVNRDGDFSFRSAGDYAALTHVWEEGLQTDDCKRGLRRSLLVQIFNKLAPLGIHWLWIDSLSIPGPADMLNGEESRIKAQLINAMARIYQDAKQVIVIDALALQLQSVDPIEVAVVLCCGRWMTRFWTYQEIKLAANAVVMTGKGSVSFSSIVDTVTTRARLNPNKYGFLAQTFRSLQRDDRFLVQLSDIVVGCKNREAGVKLDYARALFTTLGLEWQQHFSLEAGMRIIYESRKEEAMRLVLYHGPARAKHLGWAPAVLSGMRNSEAANPGRWTSRGLMSSWCEYEILKLRRGHNHELSLTARPWSYSSSLHAVFRAYVSPEESSESLQMFEAAVQRGTARLLTATTLTDQTYGAPRVGIAVEKALNGTGDEGWVCLTLAIKMVSGLRQVRKMREWLLFHQNPTCTHPEDPAEDNDHDEGKHQSSDYFHEAEQQQCHQSENTDTCDHYGDQTLSSPSPSPTYNDDLKRWTYRDSGGIDWLWDESLKQWAELPEVFQATMAGVDSLPLSQDKFATMDAAYREKDAYGEEQPCQEEGPHEEEEPCQGGKPHHELQDVPQYLETAYRHVEESLPTEAAKPPEYGQEEHARDYLVGMMATTTTAGDWAPSSHPATNHEPELQAMIQPLDLSLRGQGEMLIGGCPKLPLKETNSSAVAGENLLSKPCSQAETEVQCVDGSKNVTVYGEPSPSEEVQPEADSQQSSFEAREPSGAELGVKQEGVVMGMHLETDRELADPGNNMKWIHTELHYQLAEETEDTLLVPQEKDSANQPERLVVPKDSEKALGQGVIEPVGMKDNSTTGEDELDSDWDQVEMEEFVRQDADSDWQLV
ncbi:hypothetical protein B0T21DRAFT_358103 [Apiosordaria backusii]|uniref:Heterokaryon incompatibility domain-containing protein n=1 Tax=Apiosordaria backusii TaxID=314023 RepID=A0AA40ESE1_9PEZI|nr:hypothetical protein B0T21DRAFT_358103 [Apiosordaria backusii]